MTKSESSPPPCLVSILSPNNLCLNALSPTIINCALSTFTNFSVYDRNASYDLCYLYFQKNHGRLSNDMENACMNLWSYLASWGMLRNSQLLYKSPACLKQLIIYFDQLQPSDWTMDVPSYPLCKNRILQIYNDMECILHKIIPLQRYLCTLITKIMLGVLGCVPAFDRNFTNTFQILYGGFYRLSNNELDNTYAFFRNFQNLFNNKKIFVIDFNGKPTNYIYTIAKLIDMFGFIVGQYVKP